MGIKDLKHLKNTLTQINQNKSLLEEKQLKSLILKKETGILIHNLNQKKKKLSRNGLVKEEEEKMEKKILNSEKKIKESSYKQELNMIKKQIKDINNEILESGKRRTKRNTSVLDENGPILVFSIFLWIALMLHLNQNYIIPLWFYYLIFFGVPLSFYIVLIKKLNRKLQAEMVDSEIIKNLNDLIGKRARIETSISNQKHNFQKRQKKLKGIKKHQLTMSNGIELAESDLEKHIKSVSNIEQGINDLSIKNQEAYESIKHLIPYSNYV